LFPDGFIQPSGLKWHLNDIILSRWVYSAKWSQMAPKRHYSFNKTNLIHPLTAPFFVMSEPLVSAWGTNRLIVLFAHLYPDSSGNFNQNIIRKNLQYRAQECNVLPLREAMKRLDRNQELPPRAVAILVDDATKAFEQKGRFLAAGFSRLFQDGFIQPSGLKWHLNDIILSIRPT